MDFDVIDDTRPRLQLKSGPVTSSSLSQERHVNKVQVGICCSVGVALVGLGCTLIVPLQFLAMWLGLSLIVGPLAPISLTGGDCRVGVGETIPPPEEAERPPESTNSRIDNRKAPEIIKDAKILKDSEELVSGAGPRSSGAQKNVNMNPKVSSKGVGEAEGKDFTYEELDLLKKLLIKHPRGTMKRWEVIAEALGGKHSADNVVKMAKALSEKKISDQDSYTRFLAQRKGSDLLIASPLTQRSDYDSSVDLEEDKNAAGEAIRSEPDGTRNGQWTETEDKALLTALKTFPKDSPMRWDKVAMAIQGRSKAQCFRRFAELRKNFRNSKADGEVE